MLYLRTSYPRSITVTCHRPAPSLLQEPPKRIIRVWGRHGGPILVLRATHSATGCVPWVWTPPFSTAAASGPAPARGKKALEPSSRAVQKRNFFRLISRYFADISDWIPIP